MRPSTNQILFLTVFVFAIASWCPPSFARQAAVGPGITPLDADGMLDGVDMSVSGVTGTLSVGVVGGPQTDIFTSNNPPVGGFLAVSTGVSSQGNITFNSSSTVYGDIGVTQPGGPFLLDITGGNDGAEVNFLGNVFATTLNVTGTGEVNFNSGSTNITATNFAADGTISLAPNTTVIGALTTTVGANTGTLSLGGGSVLDGAVGGAVGLKSINVVGGSNTTGVSATITGAADAFAFSLGTNTLNIGGALTIANLAPGGVINTTLASSTLYGNIRPVGATNLGPTLGVNVTVPSTTFLPVGSQFNIIQTQTGTPQSGTDGSVVAVTVQNPTNPLYTFSAVPPAGTLAGLVTIETTGIPLLVPINPPSVPLPPTLPIAIPIVPVIIAVAPTPTAPIAPVSDLVDVLAGINSLSDPAAVVDAVAQLAPSTSDLVTPLVTFQGNRQFQNLWLSRLNDVMCSQTSQLNEKTPTCQKNDPYKGWWLKGFGYAGSQGAQGPFTAYDSRILGTMIAYDAPLDNTFLGDARAGIGLGYARSMIDGKTFGSSTNFDTYQATAYLGRESGPWFVYGNASFGWNDYSGTRHISFGGVDRLAQSDYSGQDYTGFATTGYHFPTPWFTITPLASLQYTHMNLNNYTETGAGDVNLNVDSQSYNFLESGLGAKLERSFKYNYKNYVPEAHFKWLHKFHNPTLENTASFTAAGGSPSFTTPGLKTSDNTFNLGGGITFLSCNCSAKTWSLEAVYDYDWRTDNYSAHQVMMKFSSRF